MAPFKLKFRMGSGSRSTSQEIEEPVQQPLLTRQSSICDSSTTIDSEFTSMSSTNDQHNLLPNKFDEETGYENPAIMRTITDSRCYKNVHASTSPQSATVDNEHEQCGHQCEGEALTNTPANDGAASVGTQIFLSNSAQSNDNLLDSTVGSSDPLFVGQNLEDVNLDVNTGDTENEHCSNIEQEQDCLSTSSDENASSGAWQTNENNSQDVQSTVDTIISNKSSKKIYKAVAREWGITCKMSETCRCMDCQSNYFDCEYEENENQKTDGGLGAGTPMFINEVMHGSACTII